MIMKKTIDKYLFILFVLFPLSTLISCWLLITNKILISIIILLLVLSLFCNKMKPNTIILFFTFLISYVWTLFKQTSFFNFNDLLYLPIWILVFSYFTFEGKFKYFLDYLKKNSFVNAICILWILLLGISCVLNRNFISIHAHRYAASAFSIMVLSIISFIDKGKIYHFIPLIPFVTFFFARSRTYLFIGIILMMIYIWYLFNNKLMLIALGIPIFILFMFILSNTSLGDRMLNTDVDGYYGVVGTFTSGRSVFWAADLKGYQSLNVIDKILGSGYNTVYYLNKEAVGTYIWAHNDYINVLLSNGILGLICYFASYISMVIYFLHIYKVKKTLIICISFLIFFNAMFNGAFDYMCFSLCIPFMILVCYKLQNYKSSPQKVKRSLMAPSYI